MTSLACISGAARVAEIAQALSDIEIIVHIAQVGGGSCGWSIKRLTELLEQRHEIQMATLATAIRSRRELEDPGCVKVVLSNGGRALHFSRSPIPCAQHWSDELLSANPPLFYRQIGVYGYRREFLVRLAAMPTTPLESLEDLEQLRALEHGFPIAVAVVDEPSRAAGEEEERSQ